jgi:hypothetical protein
MWGCVSPYVIDIDGNTITLTLFKDWAAPSSDEADTYSGIGYAKIIPKARPAVNVVPVGLLGLQFFADPSVTGDYAERLFVTVE